MSAITPAERAAEPASTAIVYRGELDYISRCILDYPDIETGGELFGFWTASGVPVVLYAIGPGPRANHEVAFFNQDLAYLKRVGNRLISAYGLQHIGEWHSHHRLGLAKPSGHDAQTMVHSIDANGLGRFLLCIGNCGAGRSTLNAFAFHQDSGYDYRHAAWDVKEGASPYRAVADNDPELADILVHPRTSAPAMENLLLATGEEQLVTPDYSADYWLNRKENNLALKRILDFLADVAPQDRCAPKLDAENRVVIAVDRPDRRETILFPARFPLEAPLLDIQPRKDEDRPSFLERFQKLCGRINGRARIPDGPLGDRPLPDNGPPNGEPALPEWTYAGDIVQAFESWYRLVFAPPPPAPPEASTSSTPPAVSDPPAASTPSSPEPDPS